ncbi:hypothetical protein Taro_021126 [Colocasia esculenta]|uniref:Uncharacterized protein n=1 Tax=Colocasia esculenta TaxID=4460 RepID=A0A843UY47_COLES|nr:hypothetical protein [Colocasia esculenta]
MLRNPPLLRTRRSWRSRSGRDGLAGRDEIATLLEVAIWSRRPGRSRRDRHTLGCRDLVTTARTAVTGSRQGETSQQRQGARRAEETERWYVAFLKATYPLSPSGLMDGAMGTRVEDKTSVDAPDRETSQQRQGARRAKETGR